MLLLAAVQPLTAGGDTGFAHAARPAPDDSTTLTPLRIGLGTVRAEEEEPGAVPLLLLDTVAAGAVLHPLELLVEYDPAQLLFDRIEAPAGSLLHGVRMKVRTVMDGIAVKTQDSVILQAGQTPGVLAMLYFKPGLLHGADSLFIPLQLSQGRFTAGSFVPVLSGGGVTVVPAMPDLVCSVQAPRELTWDSTVMTYVPNPVPITVSVVNIGTILYPGSTALISYEPADALLISPVDKERFCTPDSLPPGGTANTAWTLIARPRSHSDSVVITVSIHGIIHGRAKYMGDCSATVFIPRAGAAFTCALQADPLRVHPAEQRVDPLPFRVEALVNNAGGYALDTMRAAIQLPPGLSLAWPDAAGDTVKRYAGTEFKPRDSWKATWHLSGPPAEHDSTYRIRVIAQASILEPVERTIDVTLPGLGPLRPRLPFVRDTLNLGNAILGRSSGAVLAFGNTGALPLHLSGATFTGADSAAFALESPLPGSVAFGETARSTMLFTPASLGEKSAVLRFATDDPDRPAVAIALVGRGVGAPRLMVDSVVDFGTVPSGDTGVRILEVRNTGASDLRLLGQSIGGIDGKQFHFGAHVAFIIAPGTSSPMTLHFLPSGSGPRSAMLVLCTIDTTEPPRVVVLKGNAGTVGVDDASALPDAPLLHANHPNPFAASTLISFTLAAAADARLAVCDALGREVALLHNGAASTGTTTLRFDAAHLPGGLYFAVLRAGGRLRTLPMVKAARR
jgi:hypothetical protein